MSNPETKAQYEGAILNQLVKNAEKLSVIEFKFSQLANNLNGVKLPSGSAVCSPSTLSSTGHKPATKCLASRVRL